MIKQILVTTAVATLMIWGGLARSANSADAPKFVAAQSADQWVFSKFKGTDVVGPNNETIGGVNDVLFDKSGKISGIVVGVGGFLGIGQKNVAIDISAFEPVPAASGTPVAAGTTNDPTNVKLKVASTKEELQKAPDFQYFKPPPEPAGERPTTTGMGQRQSPMAPLLPPQQQSK